jgi:hypothetical protein
MRRLRLEPRAHVSDNAMMFVSQRAADAASAPVSGPALAPLTAGILQHRRILYGLVIGFMLFAFSGTWRVGRDSALYRSLGHSLATGKGYHAGIFASKQIYPGLPTVLAGLEKIFGQRDLPPILLINLMAVACLLVTYRLVSLRFERWMAIVVTVGVGINGWFLELANEIRDDIPFLLGLLLALYGWERLRLRARREDGAVEAPRRPAMWGSLVCLFAGLALAAVMRPTFWIVVAAWVLVCAGGLIRGPRRLYAICLAMILLVVVVLALVDPRVQGFKPFAGGYERDAKAALHAGSQRVEAFLPKMLGGELSYGIFGEKWGPGLTQLMTIALIVSSLWLARHDPLWTLLALLTVFVTLVMGPVPRYYVMIVPLMLMGWLLMFVWLAHRVPAQWAGIVLLLGMALYGVTNIERCVKVVAQQRGWKSMGREEDRPKWQSVMDISEAIRRDLPANAKIIAPAAPIVSYMTDRQALMWRDLDPHQPPSHYPAHLRAMGIGYAVFPSDLYDKGERRIKELMDRGVIEPTKRISKIGDMMIATVRINVPQGNWEDQPIRSLTPKLRALGRPTPQEIAHRQAKKRALEKKARQSRHQHQMEKARRQRKLRMKRDPAYLEARKRRARRAAAATQRAAHPPASPPLLP